MVWVLTMDDEVFYTQLRLISTRPLESSRSHANGLCRPWNGFASNTMQGA